MAALALVCAAPSVAQTKAGGTGAATTAAPPVASLEGTVVRATDGQPLKKARLTLRRVFDAQPQGLPGGPGSQEAMRMEMMMREQTRNAPYIAASDVTGKFTIPNVTPGRYRLTVERQGYVRTEYGQRQPGRAGATITLNGGQKMGDLLFRLLEDGVISGRVTDEDGEPVISGNVQVMRLAYARGQKQLVPAGGGATNDKGEYRVFGLTPGRYFVSATASPQFGGPGGARFSQESPALEEVYAPSFYPGTTDPQNAMPLQVGAGDEITSIDLSIAPQRAFRIRGRITAPPQPDASQQRRGGIQATLLRRTSSGSLGRAMAQQAQVDQEQGTFEFRAVLPGAYLLMTATSDGRRWVSHREPVDVGRADIEGINIVMGSGIDVGGKVRLEGMAGVTLNQVRVSVVPRDEQFFGVPSSVAGPDGTFTLPGLSTETYFFQVQGVPPGSYLKSARIGGEELVETGIAIPAKAGSALELVVSGNAGRVEGVVLDSDSLPAAAVTVVLVPSARRRANPTFYRTATTDAQGKFTMQSLPPGDYKLFAWDDVDPGAWQDAEFLAPFEERGAKITIAEGSALVAEVKLLINK